MLVPSTASISPRMTMFQATSRQRMLRKRFCTSVLDGVAHAAHGADQRTRKTTVDLVAKVVDVDLDNVRGGLTVVAPDVLGDLVLTEDAARIAHEIGQQIEFLGGQLDAQFAALRLVAAHVEHQVANLQLILGAIAGAASERTDTGQQLLKGEGF